MFQALKTMRDETIFEEARCGDCHCGRSYSAEVGRPVDTECRGSIKRPPRCPEESAEFHSVGSSRVSIFRKYGVSRTILHTHTPTDTPGAAKKSRIVRLHASRCGCNSSIKHLRYCIISIGICRFLWLNLRSLSRNKKTTLRTVPPVMEQHLFLHL